MVNTGKWKLTGVRVGEYDTETEEDCYVDEYSTRNMCAHEKNHQDFGIEKIKVHEDYDFDSAHNDIALIRLSRNVPKMEFVKPVCLPWSRRNEDSSYFAVGELIKSLKKSF